MYTCAECGMLTCTGDGQGDRPSNCPMHDRPLMDAAFLKYGEDANRDFFRVASEIERMGYCKWPRLRETMEFAKRVGYTKLGLAFCAGLQKEARILVSLLRKNRFEVSSIICKTGSISKEKAGIDEQYKFTPGEHEAMCNPVAQAMFLNNAGTEFNIVLGLCVGHDSLFYKYSQAPVTTLVAKDRVMGHNPAAALYCANGYAKAFLED